MTKIIKNNEGELVTREILKSELSKFGKKIDKKFDEERQKNIEFFASKQDLKDGLDNLENRLNVKLDKLTTGTEKLLAKWDKKEQEDIMHSHQHKVAEDRLADHDKRLDKIEKSASFAH